MSAETIAVCVNEKTAEPALQTVTLQFLSALFTEETKRAEITTSNFRHVTPLSDIVNGPSGSQLCELLLLV